MRTADSKQLPVDTLAERLAAARAEGRRVALVAGGFALLHEPVLRRLAEAQTQADVLVAVVLDDPAATLAPVAERAIVVAGLRAVDYVLVATRDALPDLQCRLQPDTELPLPEDETRHLLERLRR